jgi:hypothetical protein
MRQLALALLLAAVVATAVRWGSFVAGGSDSYCYVHQAERWASFLRQGSGGQAPGLQIPEPLALEAPWPDAPVTFAPAGHVPSRTVPGALVPICPSGLSIAMAPLLALGGRGAMFLVVPLFGALLVWATFTCGSRFGSRVGLASAVLIACSPPFLYQLMQPMSDVPAAALWMLAVAAVTGTKPRAPVVAGIATAAAILMRPNLAPMAIPIGLFILLRPERSWQERLQGAMRYAAAAAPGAIAVALIQREFYGSPLQSGYGSLEALFSIEHIGPNAVRYFSWMSQTHTFAWLLALAAPVLLPGPLSALLISLTVVNVASYLPYVVFEEWSFLRFLLPAIPLLLTLMVAVIDATCRRVTPGGAGSERTRPTSVWLSATVVSVATVVLAVVFVREARDHDAFRLQRFEARYERAGTFVDRRLPPNAIVITSWQSGSVRLYGHRRTLVWDALDPDWLDRAVAFVRARGLEPYLLFESWEEPIFRARFASSSIGALDWPPMAEVASQVRIYRPDDRERYARGTLPPTEYAR